MRLACFVAVALAHSLVSPDGRQALFAKPGESRLWIENLRTHEERKVFDATVQTLTVDWAPDSAAFIANDREASDREFAWIYDVRTLDRLDLEGRIAATDPQALRFVPTADTAPHSYAHAIRWLDAQHVEVRLHGHTDGFRRGNSIVPGDCFDLRYRIGRDGAVRKLSQRVMPISDRDGCPE